MLGVWGATAWLGDSRWHGKCLAPSPGLTGGASMEIVVVLRHIGQDAQPVGHLQGHHVLSVQQGWDAQLLLGHMESLAEGGGQQGWDERPLLSWARPPAPPRGARDKKLLGAQEGICSALVIAWASVHQSVQRRSYPDPAGSERPGVVPVGSRKQQQGRAGTQGDPALSWAVCYRAFGPILLSGPPGAPPHPYT